VNATYFEQFVRRIGAPISAMQPSESSLFSTETVEEAFLVEEAAFDAAKLRNRVRSDLNTANVEVLTGVVAQHVCRERGRVTVTCQSADDKFELEAGHVFNCAFSGINRLLRSSGLDPLPMKFELAELALVEPPAELRDVGITVMCGPFFSCMPFPALGLHSLSHVRYTPHFAWTNDTIEDALEQETWRLKPPETHFPLMVRDAARFVPAWARCRYRNSLWEVKAILQNSESNDSRPILFARDVGMPGLHCVLGAKIDNVYDILDEIDRYLQASRMAA
jgi:glycine/D-amino acid oxidase-like deaminating enzyme